MSRAAILAMLGFACQPTPVATPAVVPLGALGGAATVENTTVDAFGQPAPGLTQEQEDAFFVGNALFNRNWVTAPSSTEGTDGLGPTFNAMSCAGCHFKDGRGAPPASPDDHMVSMLVRLSNAANYGGQLNDHAIQQVPAEGWASVSYVELAGTYDDGTPYSLRQPRYEFRDLAFGSLDGAQFSPRVANQMIGLGLLAAIPDATIRALADPEDNDGDGISGRVNEVDDVLRGTTALGRFGWKANQPTLSQQVQGALLGDIGITSPLFTGENCPAPQTACTAAANGGTPEADEHKVQRMVEYSATLAVPAQRKSKEALRGQGVFSAIGCDTCHVMTLRTGAAPVEVLANQTIHPFTDLLLHDMGDGLADHRPDFLADGNEWRTPPLWGLGLVQTVNKHDALLHDGRARGFAEAILWHGGEAQAAADAFRALSADGRADLIAFLESL